MKLSVVVAAWNGEIALRRCLEALAGQGSDDVEVIVVCNQGLEKNQDLPRNPTLRFIEHPGVTVPELRAAGIAAAKGAAVALTEDHCEVAPDWVQSILRSHENGHDVVVGSVENAEDSSPIAWAVYLFDYGAFAPGVKAGQRISGVNVSFRRAALETLRGAWSEGLIEFEMEDALRSAGMTVFRSAEMRVIHFGRYRTRRVTMKFFRGGRFFGGLRRERSNAGQLLFRIAAQPLVPMVILGRIGSRILNRPKLVGQYLLTLPWLVVLSVAWSLGEGTGYLMGKGDSSSHWR
ncbi:MAG: glycosyltransferase [Acidobacteriota bacterium]